MKKVGDILRSRRIEKNLSLEDVEKKTKIRKKFLAAIEIGQHDDFSSVTYIRGFIKNYSEFLGLPVSEILALFRREYEGNKEYNLLPKPLDKHTQKSLFLRITPQLMSIFVSLVILLIIFGYLISSYLDVTGTPELVVTQPKQGETITTDEVTVIGKTHPDAKVTINNQEIIISENGEFTQKVIVGKKATSIKVVAENKQGKKAVVERIIEVK